MGLQVLRIGKALTNHEDVFIRKDGSFFDVMYSSSPLQTGGRIAGLVVVFRDISDRKRSENTILTRDLALTSANEALKKQTVSAGRSQQRVGRIFLFGLARLACAAADHRRLQPHRGRRSWPSFERRGESLFDHRPEGCRAGGRVDRRSAGVFETGSAGHEMSSSVKMGDLAREAADELRDHAGRPEVSI